jgi:hypothetical protein
MAKQHNDHVLSYYLHKDILHSLSMDWDPQPIREWARAMILGYGR